MILSRPLRAPRLSTCRLVREDGVKSCRRKVVGLALKPGVGVSRFALTFVGIGALALGLSGCSADDSPAPSPRASPGSSASPSPSPSVSPSAPASASPSASPSPTAAPVVPGKPISAGCVDLVSLQTMYEFNPNFGLVEDAPASGSLAATAVANGGVACTWVQATDRSTIVIGVAQPSKTKLAELRASGEGFTTAGGVGTVQIFTDKFWIVASSAYFSTAGDAQMLTDSVKSALG